MALRFYGRNATGLLAGICESLQRETCVTVRTSPLLTVILDNCILENRVGQWFQACSVRAERQRRKTSPVSSSLWGRNKTYFTGMIY